MTGERFLVSALANSGGLSAAGVVPSDPGLTANAVISGNGQRVAFVSNANAATLIDDFISRRCRQRDPGRVRLGCRHGPERRLILQPEPDRTGQSGPVFGNAVGLVTGATNPAISVDGSVVAFVTSRDATDVGSILDDDNGDLTPDVFRASVSVALPGSTSRPSGP